MTVDMPKMLKQQLLPLSHKAQEVRKPLPPIQLLGALQDRQDFVIKKILRSRTVKMKYRSGKP